MMRPDLKAVACIVLTDRPGGRTRIGGNAMPRRQERVITKRTVDALSVEHRDAVFWDRDLPGWGFRPLPPAASPFANQPGDPSSLAVGLLRRESGPLPAA